MFQRLKDFINCYIDNEPPRKRMYKGVNYILVAGAIQQH